MPLLKRGGRGRGGRNPTAADGENAKEVSGLKKREVTGKCPEFPKKKV